MKGSRADQDIASQAKPGDSPNVEATGPLHREGRSTQYDKNGKRIPSIKGPSGVASADRRINSAGQEIDVSNHGVTIPKNGGHY